MAGSILALALLLALALTLGEATVLPAIMVVAATGVLLATLLVSRMHAEMTRSVDDLGHHMEAFLWLQAQLGPDCRLPPTGGWAASPDLLLVMVGIVDEEQPELVVELGSGVSTLVLAARLRRLGKGRVISLDHDAAFADQTRSRLASLGLEGYAQVIHAPLERLRLGGRDWQWYKLADVEMDMPIEMLVVDGPPATEGRLDRYPALPALASHLASGAVVLLDDADRPDETEIVHRWLAENPGLGCKHLPLEKGAFLLRTA